MPCKRKAASQRPVNRRVLTQGDHDVVCVEARSQRLVSHAAVQRALLIIASALQKSDFNNAGIRRSVHAVKGWVQNHLVWRKPGNQLKTVVNRDFAGVYQSCLNGISECPDLVERQVPWR